MVKAVHGQIRQQLLVHKESKDPEVPELFVEDLDDVLKHSGVPEEKVEIFNEACRKEFGDQSILNPINVMESKKFEMKTPEVKITVDPEYTYLITTQEIDGSQYLLIPAGEGVTVNGIDISVGDGEEEPKKPKQHKKYNAGRSLCRKLCRICRKSRRTERFVLQNKYQCGNISC